MKDKLRTLVQKTEILDIMSIENSDNLEVAQVLGWKVVVNKKDKIKKGDTVVYFATDSFLPIEEQYEFLRSSSFQKDWYGNEGFRLRTIKLRGQISQGLIFSLEYFKENKQVMNAKNGEELCEYLNVTIYEPPINLDTMGTMIDRFHHTIQKTDELRVQEVTDYIEELARVTKRNKEIGYYISEKIDGRSLTIMAENNNGEPLFRAFSRTNEIDLNKKGTIKKFLKENRYIDKLEEFFKHTKLPIFFQGELYGEKIQGNKLGIRGWDFKYFNIGNPETGEYYDFRDWKQILQGTNLETQMQSVDIIEIADNFEYTLDELLEKAKGRYKTSKNHREGIVIRPTREVVYNGKRLSFKVLNNDFLLREC